MSLTRGFGGKRPCPICLVPDTKLSDLSHDYEPRTAERMQEVLAAANGMDRKSDGDDLLKSYGLRRVEVCPNLFYLSMRRISKSTFRMCSGKLKIPTHSVPFRLIVSM